MSDIFASLPPLTQLSFALPWAFILLPLPVVVFIYSKPYTPPEDAVRVPFLSIMLQATGQTATQQRAPASQPIYQRIIALLCWIALVTTVAGPQQVEPPQTIEKPVRDILLVLDTSGSMSTVDFSPQSNTREMRLDAVKQVVADFIGRRKDDRIGLAIFGTGAFPQAPFSEDHQALLSILDSLIPGIAGEQTAIGDAIGVTIRMFENSDGQEKVAILLTDGNDTTSSLPPSVAAKLAAKNDIIIHTIAIGIPGKDDENKVDTALLASIAEETGGLTFQGTDKQQLQEIYQQIDLLTPHKVESLSWSRNKPLYMYSLLLMITLLLAGLLFYGMNRLFAARPKATSPKAVNGSLQNNIPSQAGNEG